MKLPSIIKTPKYQKFHITPRYYDPVKEDLDHRRDRIIRELARSGQLNDDEQAKASTEGINQIKGAFSRRKVTPNRSASLLQLVLMTVMITLAFGYLEYGNDIFYSLFLIVPIYLYLRWKKII